MANLKTLKMTIDISKLTPSQVEDLEAALVAQTEDFPALAFSVDIEEAKNPIISKTLFGTNLDLYVSMIEEAFPKKEKGWALRQLQKAIDNVEGIVDHETVMDILAAEFGVGKGA